MKTVTLGPDGQPAAAFILDLEGQTITQVDYRGRQYVAATVQEYVQGVQRAQQRGAGERREAMKQLQRQLEGMSPEQRKLVEEMLKQQMAGGPGAQECKPPRVETRRSGQQATVAGYPAVRFDVLADGAPESEMWIARGLGAWSEIDRQKLERLSAEMAKLAGCGPGSRGRLGADPSWQLAAEGYPVRVVGRGPDAETVEVVKAETRALPAAEFQPPPGFTRKSLAEMTGGR
jgi:hypothetical protein